MPDLLTPEQFVARAVGMPWQRWRSDWRSCDCFGLIVLYFREVLGIDLGPVPEVDIAAGFIATKGWVECGPEPGATAWMSWLHGAPMHCGILLANDLLLHAAGSAERGGSVRVMRLAAASRVYGELSYYRYSPC